MDHHHWPSVQPGLGQTAGRDFQQPLHCILFGGGDARDDDRTRSCNTKSHRSERKEGRCVGQQLPLSSPLHHRGRVPEDMSKEHITSHAMHLWDMRMIDYMRTGQAQRIFGRNARIYRTGHC